MNRQQAEHILDAYVKMANINMVKFADDEDPSMALREVILDAMTEYKSSTITVPNITYPQTTPNYGKTIVTCGVSE